MFSKEYMIYAIICVGIFTVYMAVMNMMRADRFSARVNNAAGFGGDNSDRGIAGAFTEFCEKVTALFTLSDAEKKLRAKQLMAAGIQSPNAMTYIVFYNRVIQPLFLLVAAGIWVRIFLVGGLGVWGLLLDIMISVLCYIAGRSGVDIYLRRRRKQRQRILMRFFPEVLDLLLVCIESGLGLDAALARASREMDVIHPLIVAELDRTRLELSLLADRVQALQNLADRADIIPFRALVAALIQTEKFGTSLVETLRVLAEDQRVTRLLETENKVARIPALVTVPLILCILPAFIIVLIGPPMVSVIDGGGFNMAPPSKEDAAKKEAAKKEAAKKAAAKP